MTIVQPIKYEWLSCNAPDDPSIATWSSGAAYKKLDMVEHLGRIYKAAKDIDSSGTEPSEAINDWVDFGAVNSRAFCDELISSQTRKDTKQDSREYLELSINLSDYCDMFALINVNALGVEFVGQDFRFINNWFDYFYKSFEFSFYKRYVTNWLEYFTILPELKHDKIIKTPYKIKGQITIRLYGVDGYAALGMLVCGNNFYVGETLRGAQIGAISYTKKVTDEWGNSTIRKGRTAKKNQYEIVIDTARIDAITNSLNKSLEVGLCVFAGDSRDAYGLDSLLIYGILTEFNLSISTMDKSELSIGIEGII